MDEQRDVATTAMTAAGIATVSLLHTALPQHWLPFAIVGRAQKWHLRHTLCITAIAGIGHVTTTSILGVMAIYLSTSLLPDIVVHHMSSIILCILGMAYIVIGFFSQSHGCCHHHQSHYDIQELISTKEKSGGAASLEHSKVDRVAEIGLIMAPTLSPCATTLPMFLTITSHKINIASLSMLIGVFLISTVVLMVMLVALSHYGFATVRLKGLEKWDKTVVGLSLLVVGVVTALLHSRLHHHGDEHHHHDH